MTGETRVRFTKRFESMLIMWLIAVLKADPLKLLCGVGRGCRVALLYPSCHHNLPTASIRIHWSSITSYQFLISCYTTTLTGDNGGSAAAQCSAEQRRGD
jgi:hypothetical protein